MIIKGLRTGLLIAAAAASLSALAPTGASAHGFFLGGPHIYGGHWHAGYWGRGYWGRGYWGRGIVLQNGCPAYYVRDGGLCYPTF